MTSLIAFKHAHEIYIIGLTDLTKGVYTLILTSDCMTKGMVISVKVTKYPIKNLEKIILKKKMKICVKLCLEQTHADKSVDLFKHILDKLVQLINEFYKPRITNIKKFRLVYCEPSTIKPGANPISLYII